MDSTPWQNASEGSPTNQLLQMIYGSFITQMIAVAAQLGIADLLHEGPKSLEELAAATDSHAPTLYRLMRALASVGLFAENEPRRFVLSPLASLLRTDTPDSLHDYAILCGSDFYFRSLTNLRRSAQSGKPALELTFGMNLFEYLQQHPSDAAMFNAAMTSISRQEAIAVRDAYDFSGLQTVADIGGGHGVMLAIILKANASLRGILFDRPAVVQGAAALLQKEGVADRCQMVEGDFFAAVPAGADAYLLKYIIHDWDDGRARQILSNCRQAMSPAGRILVVDAVLPTGNTPFIGKLKDIIMMTVAAGGMERTAAEFQDLFAKAGFQLSRIISTQALVSIVEGIPV